MDTDISAQDRFYRRGLVLGFTLAEVMVLIIFALLLATSWYLAAKDKKIDKLEAANRTLEERVARGDDFDDQFRELKQADEQRAAQEQVIAALREKVTKVLEERTARDDDFDDQFRELKQADEQRAAQEQVIAALREKVTKALEERAARDDDFDDQFRELKQADEQRAAQEQVIAALREKVTKVLEERAARDDDFDDQFRELKQADEQRAAQEQVIAALREKVETLENETKALEERATVAEKFMEMAREAGVPTEDPEKAVQEIASHLEQLAKVREGVKAAGLDDNQITEFVENSLSKLAEAEWLGKGTELPACWASRTGKSEYIFDVALTSRGIITHDNALPHRTAEQAQLPLQTIVFDYEVQSEQFLKTSKPVFEWSKREGCRFFVRVSDRTKGEEKAIYKQLLWTVGQRFYSYEVRNGAL